MRLSEGPRTAAGVDSSCRRRLLLPALSRLLAAAGHVALLWEGL